MKKSLVIKLFPPLALAAGIAFISYQFFLGPLGVLDGWETRKLIKEAQLEIEELKAHAKLKQHQIDLLTNDKGAIRSLALLYGMTGGEEIPLTPLPTQIIKNPTSASVQARQKNFLLRHPELIIIPGVIVALVAGFLLTGRRRKETLLRLREPGYPSPVWPSQAKNSSSET